MILWLNNTTALLWAITKFLGLIFLDLLLLGLILATIMVITVNTVERERFK